MDRFKALLITRDEATKKQSVGVTTLSRSDLMEGDVEVRVEYSTVNYKDGLAITGKLPVVRKFSLWLLKPVPKVQRSKAPPSW